MSNPGSQINNDYDYYGEQYGEPYDDNGGEPYDNTNDYYTEGNYQYNNNGYDQQYHNGYGDQNGYQGYQNDYNQGNVNYGYDKKYTGYGIEPEDPVYMGDEPNIDVNPFDDSPRDYAVDQTALEIEEEERIAKEQYELLTREAEALERLIAENELQMKETLNGTNFDGYKPEQVTSETNYTSSYYDNVGDYKNETTSNSNNYNSDYTSDDYSQINTTSYYSTQTTQLRPQQGRQYQPQTTISRNGMVPQPRTANMRPFPPTSNARLPSGRDVISTRQQLTPMSRTTNTTTTTTRTGVPTNVGLNTTSRTGVASPIRESPFNLRANSVSSRPTDASNSRTTGGIPPRMASLPSIQSRVPVKTVPEASPVYTNTTLKRPSNGAYTDNNYAQEDQYDQYEPQQSQPQDTYQDQDQYDQEQEQQQPVESPFANLPPHDDPSSFRLILLLLERGQTIIQIAPKTCNLTDVKKLIINSGATDICTEIAKKVAFKIPGAGWMTNEHVPIGQVPYFQDAAKRKEDPRLMIVRKDGGADSYYKLIKLDEIGIGKLLRAPMAWQTQDDENTAFRQCMARVRLQERQNVKRVESNFGVNFPIVVGDDPPSKNFLVILLVSKATTKKVSVNVEDTADSFLERVWRYFDESKNKDLNYLDYALVVKGLSVHAAGPVRLRDLEYFQRCIATNTEIVLYVTPRKAIQSKKVETSYLFEAEERFLETDPVVHFDHVQISQGRGPLDIKSVWDFNNFFAVRIESATNLHLLPGASGLKQMNVSVRMQIMCGDEVLWPTKEMLQESKSVGATKPYEVGQNGTANFGGKETCVLGCPIKTCDLPRESKLVFSLYVSDAKDKKKKKKKGDSDAWVNCIVYSYKNELRCGDIKLKMWKGKLEQMGTVVSNSSDPSAVELTIQFAKSESYTIVFPTEPMEYQPYPHQPPPNPQDQQKLDQLICQHSLKSISKEGKDLIWKYRNYCMRFPAALPKFLQSVNKTDRVAIQEMHRLLIEWAPITPVEALELLDARFADQEVRKYAVSHLEELTNAEVEDYLLQLCQVLKHETYHDSPLSRFLLQRAIRNKRVGHYLYWSLKSELHHPQLCERFTLMLDCFLKSGGTAREDITQQEMIHQAIVEIAYKVKNIKETKNELSLLQNEVKELNKSWPGNVQLMLDPLFVTKGITVEKCKVMDSKMRPLWLLFQNADPRGDDINIIFKCGDDLRQDMLTLQMFRIFDKLWKKETLDLMLNPYRVIATGGETGMVEVVTKSNTISAIQKDYGGGAAGAFKDEVIFKWLQEKNSAGGEDAMKLVVENFTASCAGYCVATYVLGIGDRHNGNIMVKEDGHLFHIDFGHILGNFKDFHGINRERVPFVFTPDLAYVMGGKGEKHYNKFVGMCMSAHKILQKHSALFINLFSMMLISGMPELQTPEDILYIVNTLNMSDDKEAKPFQSILNESGSQISTRVNFFFHNLVH